MLASHGLPIIGAAASAALIKKVGAVEDFEPTNVIEQLGWNGDSVFVLPNGDHFPTRKRNRLPTTLPCIRGKTEVGGTLEEWLDQVAAPLAGHVIPEFAMMFMFAAPLLELTDRVENFGFELVGGKGTGKTTIQRLMSSAAGGIGYGSEGQYFEHFDSTYNGLELLMQAHKDLPLILEESNLYAGNGSRSQVSNNAKSLPFKLASGTIKKRHGIRSQERLRLAYFIGSNISLVSIIGQKTDATAAAADRLITIPLSNARRFGILDREMDVEGGNGAFLEKLMQAASTNYGHALRHFLASLVDARRNDEQGLRAEIAASVALFRAKAAVAKNNGSQRRVADAFGLVYAAGKLAVKFGALPESYNCGPSVLECFRIHLGHVSLLDRLWRLVGSADAVELGSGKLPKLTDAQLHDTKLFVRTVDGRKEVYIPSGRLKEILPDWQEIKRRPDVKRCQVRDGDHVKVKRKLSAGHPRQRVYAFSISE